MRVLAGTAATSQSMMASLRSGMFARSVLSNAQTVLPMRSSGTLSARGVIASSYSQTVTAGIARFFTCPPLANAPSTWSPRRLTVTNVPANTDENIDDAAKPA